MAPLSEVLNREYAIVPIIDDLPLAFLPNIPVMPGKFSKFM